MTEEGVAPDSSFFICFSNDLKRHEWLYEFTKMYTVYIGERILSETSKIFKDKTLLSSVNVIDVKYYEIIKPYFGRDPKHLDDGEYEAIGIAFFLQDKNILKYLILDEIRARNFVTRHFPDLANWLVGTIGFIRDCYYNDGKISTSKAVDILNEIKIAVKQGKPDRPCSMDKNSYEKILIPTLEKIKSGVRDD